MDLRELFNVLMKEDTGMEVRVGDVAEGDDLHCSVGRVVVRGGCVIISPGDDDVWKDESIASSVGSKVLYDVDGEET